ncbi:Protein kinase domain [Macleaya cordata]|uniref:Protein kinase domain n=1 Tax=Macleaya cordata TaxID=56857 RepID=A0A200RDX2_MACCD|nr:Protein kinase domain [Macleaya cordata]
MNDQTRTTTGIRGTRGYVAPEWFRNTPITVKVDVYSFGVMLLEIICCRKSIELELGEEVKAILTDWAYDCYRKGKLQDLVENDEDAMNDMRRFERLVMIAIWCIQEEPSLRPSMKKVTQMLEGVLEVSVPPCPYQFSTFLGDYFTDEAKVPNIAHKELSPKLH